MTRSKSQLKKFTTSKSMNLSNHPKVLPLSRTSIFLLISNLRSQKKKRKKAMLVKKLRQKLLIQSSEKLFPTLKSSGLKWSQMNMTILR